MLYKILCILFSLFLSKGNAHMASTFSLEQKYLVKDPVVTLFEEPTETSPLDSQAIYGQSIYMIEELANGWVYAETVEGYRGYCKKSGLTPDLPQWRSSKYLARVSSQVGIVYPTKDTVFLPVMRLPFDAKLEVLESLEDSQKRWLPVRLLGGASGWIQIGDVEKLAPKTLSEVLLLSKEFLGVPYVWGGNSSFGYDCSGYVQTLAKQMGIILPRNSSQQAKSPLLQSLQEPQNPGDLLFFGTSRVIHVGIYLGEEEFIHTGTRDLIPRVAEGNLSTTNYSLKAVRRLSQPKFYGRIFPITDEIAKKMTYSWKENPDIQKTDLCYLQMNHWGFDGLVYDGEMVVHKDLAQEVVEIFSELFAIRYPIEKIRLIDAYKAQDRLSCQDNNTSCFCYRAVVGRPKESSMHAFGRAIDINPVQNPYLWKGTIIPKNGEIFLDRTIACRGVITQKDPCYQAFIKRGWKWGGESLEHGVIDYQHFFKEIE